VPPSEPEDRQVVGPSLSENTEDSDLAKAPECISSFPDTGKWKQTGLNNRRDGTVQSKMNRNRNPHGVASFGEVVYRSEDSSVVTPVSKRPEHSTRGTSVKATHRSRQAGRPTRAGATTPPFPLTIDGTAADAIRSTPKPGGHPSESEANRSATSTISTTVETVIPEPEALLPTRPEPQEKRMTHPAHESVAGIGGLEGAVPPDRPAVGKAGDAFQGAGEPTPPAEAVDMESDADSPVPRLISVVSTDAPAPESFSAGPGAGSVHQPSARPPMHEPDGPKVHIGLLEVVVLAPEIQPGRKKSKPTEGQNLASRHYLRNF
jgi:hypothetical protein